MGNNRQFDWTKLVDTLRKFNIAAFTPFILDHQRFSWIKYTFKIILAQFSYIFKSGEFLLLQMVLDEKTEKIAALERELQSKEQQVMGVEQQLRDLQHRNQWVFKLFTIFGFLFLNWKWIKH